MLTRRLFAATAALLMTAMSARAQSGSGVLDGVVRDSAGAPLRAAVIAVDLIGRVVYSDSAGRFRIDSLPNDTLDVSVRRMGYAPAYFAAAVPANTRVSVAVRMLPNVVRLGTVVVEGKAVDLTLLKTGFLDRERLGHGVYLGPEFVEPRRGIYTSTMLREVPRMHVTCVPGGCRVAMRSGLQYCTPALYIDGIVTPMQVAGDLDLLVDSRYVRGIEVYRTLLETPPQFRDTKANCGSIVVWTRYAPG